MSEAELTPDNTLLLEILAGQNPLPEDLNDLVRELAGLVDLPERFANNGGFAYFLKYKKDNDATRRALNRWIVGALTTEVLTSQPLDSSVLSACMQRMVGHPLVDLWRPLSQAFEFGKLRRSPKNRREVGWRGSYQINLECAWSLFKNEQVVFGSADHLRRRRFYHRLSPPRESVARARWQAAHDFLEAADEARLIVTSVEVTTGACLSISLTEGYRIVAVPDSVSAYEFGPWSFWDIRKDIRWSVRPDCIKIVKSTIGKPKRLTDQL
ncbi:MAG: hypothetical protein K8R88_15825 [Armatimonadetes bacterium]|nr:hypothetical protein [Armatimonadota bacterium]